ncbi:hypothetical protein J2X20_004772 [Pelomonas saccharophila]|uniref:Uncharacterized protein n=1 Tax=Roseateles saccharophilus TaxID=304 RepID=A0ABU1YTQ0_ROSSA|nr:hypothetical protein [Roseateles saccharophilus]MDR7272098.1 hypothetical protein [Roseateles saccharophilus]
MGADSFIAFYGIKFELDPDDEDELDACGADTDPRCQKARRAGLETFTGRMTDGEDYFLYVGRRVAWLGIEHDQHLKQSAEQLASIATDVKAKLRAADFAQAPELHFQFIGQY